MSNRDNYLIDNKKKLIRLHPILLFSTFSKRIHDANVVNVVYVQKIAIEYIRCL